MRIQELEDELKTVNRRYASNIKVRLSVYLPMLTACLYCYSACGVCACVCVRVHVCVCMRGCVCVCVCVTVILNWTWTMRSVHIVPEKTATLFFGHNFCKC